MVTLTLSLLQCKVVILDGNTYFKSTSMQGSYMVSQKEERMYAVNSAI